VWKRWLYHTAASTNQFLTYEIWNESQACMPIWGLVGSSYGTQFGQADVPWQGVARCSYADAVNTTETLFEARWVPP